MYSKKLCLLAGLSVFCFPGFALADKGGNGHGKGHGHEENDSDHGHDRHGASDEHGGVTRIETSDRVVIREYVADHYKSHCPPGLAKKHNGCLPPGQAKKYRVGHALPDTVEWREVPQPLLVRLHPVPAGYQYVMVDKDVLLISEASKKIIDAVTLLSAVGK